MSVTRLGVSLLKVVATIDKPASHQGTERPETKNSDVFFPARFPKNSAGTKQTNSVAKTIAQSRKVRCMEKFAQSEHNGVFGAHPLPAQNPKAEARNPKEI